jgi:hypothetical protein
MPPVSLRELVTTTGVRVVVSAPPTPPPAPAPAPTVVVHPPEEAVRRHNELMNGLVNQYQPFLDRQAAEALGRPRGGVVTQMGSIRRKLKDRAEESERRTKLGAALRSSRPPPPED